MHLALTHNSFPEDSTDCYFHAWQLVSHKSPTYNDFTSLYSTQLSVTVISVVRLTILFPKIDLNAWDLNNSFINFGSWSIAESNMTIVAGTVTD